MKQKMRWSYVFAICAASAIAQGVFAQGADRVKLKSNIVVEGELLQYDERGVAIRLKSNREVRYEPDEIAEVDVTVTPAHKSADEAFERREFERAIQDYEKALGQESRIWAQSRIRSRYVQALRFNGQFDRAGSEFLKIAESRDDASLMVIAPLIWIPSTPVSPPTYAVAQRWRADQRAMARLFACSWLLNTGAQAEVVPELEQLETFPDQRISWMARAQRWRVRAYHAEKDEIARFDALIAKMPPEIRAGPLYVLGMAYDASGAPLDAAHAYLQVPFVYNKDLELSADALLTGAIATEKAGFTRDALKLFQEVIATYPETRWAKGAKEHLSGKTAERD